jgi:hypothetical protein
MVDNLFSREGLRDIRKFIEKVARGSVREFFCPF